MVTRITKSPKRVNLYVVDKYQNDYLFIFGKLGFIKYRIKLMTIRANYGLLKVGGKKALFITYLKIMDNFYKWVNNGVNKTLVLNGVGFKFKLFKNKLLFILGFSHIVKLKIYGNIKIKLLNNKTLKLYTLTLFRLNKFSYKIKSLKISNPYKGKGIYFKDEKIYRKDNRKIEF